MLYLPFNKGVWEKANLQAFEVILMMLFKVFIDDFVYWLANSIGFEFIILNGNQSN